MPSVESTYRVFLSQFVGVDFCSPPAVTGTPASSCASPLDPEAVRQALAAFTRPLELERCTLSRQLGVDGETLRRRFERVAARMRATDGYRDEHAVLAVTYIQPAGKQLAAAHALGLPFGTYRYRLRRAIELFAALLRSEG